MRKNGSKVRAGCVKVQVDVDEITVLSYDNYARRTGFTRAQLVRVALKKGLAALGIEVPALTEQETFIERNLAEMANGPRALPIGGDSARPGSASESSSEETTEAGEPSFD